MRGRTGRGIFVPSSKSDEGDKREGDDFAECILPVDIAKSSEVYPGMAQDAGEEGKENSLICLSSGRLDSGSNGHGNDLRK